MSTIEYETFRHLYSEYGVTGRILTVIDAAFPDREQRSAVKSLAREKLGFFLDNVRREGETTSLDGWINYVVTELDDVLIIAGVTREQPRFNLMSRSFCETLMEIVEQCPGGSDREPVFVSAPLQEMLKEGVPEA